ncbi:MAG TPA: DUF1295 domain-containing protein [Myxococcales bacterium]|nr:DUF1295 domain-containing protein [Myxococcales bacterium]
MTLAIAGANAAIVLAIATVLWLASVRLRDASIVDPWWSILFLSITANTVRSAGLGPRNGVLLSLVAIWAIRLWAHLLRRSRGKPEDPRYAAFRERFGRERYWWVSFFQVFLLQGALALLVSAPLQVAAAAPPSAPLAWMDAAGIALFLAGFTFEAVADAQLQRFRDDPSTRGQVMDRGLWSLSRHPNYFGEAVLWWGFGCFALGSPHGWVALAGPALMTFLLLRVSGVPMLDAHLRATRPGYAAYCARTPPFVPRWRG